MARIVGLVPRVRPHPTAEVIESEFAGAVFNIGPRLVWNFAMHRAQKSVSEANNVLRRVVATVPLAKMSNSRVPST